MKRFLTEQEASYLYKKMLISATETNDVEDKLHKLRAIFDTTLSFAVMGKLDTKTVPSEYYGFQAKIDLLFPDDSSDKRLLELRTQLHEQRNAMNTGVAHIANIERRRLEGKHIAGLSKSKYRSFLYNTASMVARLSSTPIPEKLQETIRPLHRKEMSSTLDIVILLELYNSLDNLDDGMIILNLCREWIAEKKRLGLEMANVSLIVYSGNLSVMANVRSLYDFLQKATTHTTGICAGTALKQALAMASKGIDHYTAAACGVMKPWLVWICHQLPKELPKELVADLECWIDTQLLSFHPLPTTHDALKQFRQFWPACHPQQLVSRLAGNLFSSMTETIQRNQPQKK